MVLPDARRTRALLGYLALGRPERRPTLLQLLRGITPLPDEASEPSVDLLEARRLIGDNVDAAPTQALRQAAALFRGDLLDGLDLPACPVYQAWWRHQREVARALRGRIDGALRSRRRREHANRTPTTVRALCALVDRRAVRLTYVK